MKKTYVLYHAGCNDGFCAAWVAREQLGEEGAVEYIPVNYGQPPPPMDDWSMVYILDFSYSREVLQSLAARMSDIVVLDHHKTAEEDLRDFCIPNSHVEFDMSRSGANMAWDHWFGGTPPLLVQYTEDCDLWKWKIPGSREVNACIASFPHDFKVWDELEACLQNSVQRFADNGRAILRYQEQQIKRICKNAIEIEMAGHKILAVNSCCHFSEVAGKLAEDRPFGAVWFVRADGKRQWSLRSRDGGVDVSEVAKLFGGGGHRNAAGFEEACSPLEIHHGVVVCPGYAGMQRV